MKYAKITGGIVEQIQPYPEAGFVEVPDSTIPGMVDNGDGTFANPVPNVVDYAAAKNLEINAWRLAANYGTFPYSGKSIACDALSRSDIDGVNGEVNNTGALPAGFPGVWKATDETYVTLADVATWKLFYTAMITQGTANFDHSQTIKTALAAIVADGVMTDAEKIAAIDALVW